MKYSKIFEVLYLVIAVVAAVEVVQLWDVDRNRAYIFIVFALVSVGMFFFRRHYRNKFNQRNK